MYRTSTESTGKGESCETLYEAARAIVDVTGGIVVGGTHSALVAFWCAHDHKVKAGYGANDTERAMLADYGL